MTNVQSVSLPSSVTNPTSSRRTPKGSAVTNWKYLQRPSWCYTNTRTATMKLLVFVTLAHAVIRSHCHADFFTTTSLEYEPIFQVFRESYKAAGLPHNRLHWKQYPTHSLNATGFGSDAWYEALQHKLQFYLASLKKAHWGAVCVLLDADVSTFPYAFKGVQLLIDGMNMRGLDLLFMREGNQDIVNSGLIFARNTLSTSKLLTSVLNMAAQERLPFGDQTAFNLLLVTNEWRHKWDFIDDAFVIWSTDMPSALDKVMFHHAVGPGTTTIQEKVEQISKIKCQVYEAQSMM